MSVPAEIFHVNHNVNHLLMCIAFLALALSKGTNIKPRNEKKFKIYFNYFIGSQVLFLCAEPVIFQFNVVLV